MPELIGAEVRQPLVHAGRRWDAGEVFTVEQWDGVPETARRSLVDLQMVRPLYGTPQSGDGPLVRVYVPAGQGKFNVIEGRVVTPEPVSREEAMTLTRQGNAAA